MEEMKKQVGSTTALFGLVTGPLTLASHLRGTRFFMDMIKNKDYSKALISYTTKVAKIMSGMYIDAGMDVVAIVDPVISQISPRMFYELLGASFSQLFARIRDQGRFSSFFVCGDATKNIQPMCNTKPGSIFVDENVNMHAAKKITGASGIILGGNIPLTSVMLYGTQQDNMKYVIDLIDEIGRKHLIIAPGCDMPYDIPPANVVGVIQALAEPRKVRKMLEDYRVEEMDIDVSLPDYSKLDHLLIEVFTIDSATCPACGYMKSTAMTATGEFGHAVRIIERKWTDRENIAIAKKLGIKHLPCMLFNGRIQYSSLIPSKDEFFKDIHEFLSRMDEKGE
ncbi:uroporphyrinogen decarboxylase [Candidatus Bathyarchaeota archaeon]|nr:uroporphyrinogen decarboxylase [Candidatus Bathyarchaeota archaeon]